MWSTPVAEAVVGGEAGAAGALARMLGEASGADVLALDAAGVVRYASPGVCAWMHLPAAQVEGIDLREVLVLPDTGHPILEVVAGRRGGHIGAALVASTTGPPVLRHACVVGLGGHQPVGTVVVFFTPTVSQPVSNDPLVERACLDLLDEAVVFLGPTLGVRRANPAVHRLLGREADELLQEWLLDADPVERGDGCVVPHDRFAPVVAIEEGRPVRDECYRLRHRDGGDVWVRMSAIPYLWTDEVVVTFRQVDHAGCDTSHCPQPSGGR